MEEENLVSCMNQLWQLELYLYLYISYLFYLYLYGFYIPLHISVKQVDAQEKVKNTQIVVYTKLPCVFI